MPAIFHLVSNGLKMLAVITEIFKANIIIVIVKNINFLSAIFIMNGKS